MSVGNDAPYAPTRPKYLTRLLRPSKKNLRPKNFLRALRAFRAQIFLYAQIFCKNKDKDGIMEFCKFLQMETNEILPTKKRIREKRRGDSYFTGKFSACTVQISLTCSIFSLFRLVSDRSPVQVCAWSQPVTAKAVRNTATKYAVSIFSLSSWNVWREVARSRKSWKKSGFRSIQLRGYSIQRLARNIANKPTL